ncbi:unnamed protein product [Rhizopus stolonifer]
MTQLDYKSFQKKYNEEYAQIINSMYYPLYSATFSQYKASFPAKKRALPKETGKPRKKIQDVERQFKLLLKEYAPSTDTSCLTFEQKQILLHSSKSPTLKKRNSTFSSILSLFSLKTKLSLNKSLKHKPSCSSDLRLFTDSKHGRSKLKSTPEYFIHMLRTTFVYNIPETEMVDLRMFLRSVIISWTNKFLILGGYDAIVCLLNQAKQTTRVDNKILQHLSQCLKTIMNVDTHNVLVHPIALLHVRDILFEKDGLDIATRNLMLHLLYTLAMLETEDLHGYDMLCRLLNEEDQMPRYTTWMNELLSISERHIQLTQAPLQTNGLSIAEEGIVNYIINHLRLVCTIVTIPPVNCPDEHDQENVRREFMQSGFDQVSKARNKNGGFN